MTGRELDHIRVTREAKSSQSSLKRRDKLISLLKAAKSMFDKERLFMMIQLEQNG